MLCGLFVGRGEDTGCVRCGGEEVGLRPLLLLFLIALTLSISFVRSLTMDTWNEKQLRMMEVE